MVEFDDENDIESILEDALGFFDKDAYKVEEFKNEALITTPILQISNVDKDEFFKENNWVSMEHDGPVVCSGSQIESHEAELGNTSINLETCKKKG